MTAEERTRYEVLFEDIQSNVRAIAEGHIAVGERMDRMEARFTLSFQQLDHRVMKLEVGFADLSKRFEQLEATVEQLMAMFEQLQARFEQLEARFERLEAMVDKLVARFEQLVTTVGTLAGTVGTLATTVDKLATTVATSSADTQQRLVSIETYLGLGPPRPRLPARRAAAKKRKAS